MVKELKSRFIKTTMLVVTLLLVVFLASVNIINFYLARQDDNAKLNQIVTQNLRSLPGVMPGNDMPPDRQAEEAPDLPDRQAKALQEPPERQLQELEDPGIASAGLRKQEQNPGRYFIARIDVQGTVVFSDLTHDPDLSAEDMIALINEADVGFAPEVTGEAQTETTGEAEAGTTSEAQTETTGAAKGMPNVKMPSEMRGSVSGYLYYARQQADGSVSYVFLDVSQETESMFRIILITSALGAALWILILLLVILLSKRAIVPIAENIEKQRQFITNAGHEIKTPLAVIVSNVDVQELHGGKTKWLDNIRSQALRLSELTKQMLMLAKMEESGTAAFTSTTFDASQALGEAVEIFRESASLRSIKISTDIEPGATIHFPKEQYQQMLELLLDNAVKYGKENGFLSVSLRADKKTIRLSFKNDCDSLPDLEPDRLFDRFYRADDSRSRQTGGSGIGLAVVRAIAQQGGGSAHVHFLPDQAIEFEITLHRGKL